LKVSLFKWLNAATSDNGTSVAAYNKATLTLPPTRSITVTHDDFLVTIKENCHSKYSKVMTDE
jgi:hypothetical protein